jgi:hypothetical protein
MYKALVLPMPKRAGHKRLTSPDTVADGALGVTFAVHQNNVRCGQLRDCILIAPLWSYFSDTFATIRCENNQVGMFFVYCK